MTGLATEQTRRGDAAIASVTGRIAEHIAAIRFEELPADIVEIARQTLLDWLAVTLAGSREDLAAILRGEAEEQGGKPVATIIGRNMKTGTQQAALVNGATSHALDYDDTNFLASAHCGVTIIPGLLALAEDRDASGRNFLAALVAGFEASGMAGAAHYRLGFHSTGTIGSFGATGACANLIRLDINTAATAFGIAASQTAGLRAMFGTMCKPLHAGKAVQNGLIATTLAARGFTSNPRALECKLGFAATHSPDYDPDRSIAPPPKGWHIQNNLFKYHAACFITHAPIECALDVRRQGVARDTIAKMKLRIQSDANDICNIAEPRTGLESKFSLRQCIASAVADVDTAALESFSNERASDPTLVVLRERIEIEFVPDMRRAYAEMEVLTKNGRRFTSRHDASKPMDDLVEQGDRLHNKLRRLAEPILGKARAAELGDMAMNVDELESIRDLTGLCVPR
jgi:2-methylcitrate dehydratase PrpD